MVGLVLARFLHVRRQYSKWVSLNLRVQDLSRQSLTWGTELPLIPHSEAFVETLHLLNVPTDARFRVAIRVYDFEPSPGGELRHVRMRVFGTTNQSLADTTVDLVPDRGYDDALPGYAHFVDLVTAFPQLAASGTVRVEITPISQGLRFWAFASVTNNKRSTPPRSPRSERS